jgi:integrase
MAQQRRERGGGSIYEDTKRPGRFIGEITVAGRRRRVSGTSKSDVRKKLDIVRNERPANRQVTVAQAVDDWLDYSLPNRERGGHQIAASTIERHHYSCEHIREQIGKARVAELDVRTIENMFKRLTTAGLAWGSQKKVLQTLMLVVDYCVTRGDVAENVARRAKVSPKAKRPVRRKALQPDEARRLLEVLRDERNGAMYALGLRLGLRPGEAAAMHWSELDLDSDPPTANITRGVQTVAGVASVVDNLKTETSRRTIELPGDLADWLRAHRQTQRHERTATPAWHDDDLVFATTQGSLTDPSNNRRDLARYCKIAEVPEVTPNELRHSCASLLSDEGVPLILIADLLGHQDTRMLERTYRHRLRPVVDVATKATWTTAN